MGIKRHIALLVFLLVLLGAISVTMSLIAEHSAQHITTVSPLSQPYVPPQPPMTPADTIAQQNKHPFQILVSYTDQGFEPAMATIHAGDTVRFIDNSHQKMWVAAAGSTHYPSVQNGCGSSDLDTCGQLKPGEFWQFTFTKKGTWQYMNNLDTSKRGTIVVQ